jgi:hypothetical protein
MLSYLANSWYTSASDSSNLHRRLAPPCYSKLRPLTPLKISNSINVFEKPDAMLPLVGVRLSNKAKKSEQTDTKNMNMSANNKVFLDQMSDNFP